MKPDKEQIRRLSISSRPYRTLQEAIHLGNVDRTEKGLTFTGKKANKGVYGGADLNHPRNKKGNANAVLRSSSILSTVFKAIAMGLLILVF